MTLLETYVSLSEGMLWGLVVRLGFGDVLSGIPVVQTRKAAGHLADCLRMAVSRKMSYGCFPSGISVKIPFAVTGSGLSGTSSVYGHGLA